MNKDWLIPLLTADICPPIAESRAFEVILDVLRPFQAAFVVGEQDCDLEIPPLEP